MYKEIFLKLLLTSLEVAFLIITGICINAVAQMALVYLSSVTTPTSEYFILLVITIVFCAISAFMIFRQLKD